MKKYGVSIFVIFVLVALTVWWTNKQTSLVDLQKQYIFTESEEERKIIIDRLEEYYLNLAIPDSIRQRVETDVTVLLDTTKFDNLIFKKSGWETTNVYVLENQLRVFLKTAMIARARDDQKICNEMLNTAKKIAKIVDKGIEADYWKNFIGFNLSLTKDKAVTWLKAESAKSFCNRYYNDVQFWRDAELYGALGLQYLKEVNDRRTKLDIIQRFQYILYEFYSFTDLSVALGERYLTLAESINYHLRANGISFNVAVALYHSDQNQRALDLLEKVIAKAEKYQEIPSMSWYRNNGYLSIADIYCDMGQYENSISVCNKVKQFELNDVELLNLHITRGRVNLNESNYEVAESEFKKALNIAESIDDIQNTIIILEHLGSFFDLLTEYARALNYYFQAEKLNEEFNLENYDKIRLLLHIAEVMATTGQIDRFNKYIIKTNNLLSLVNIPSRKAHFLFTMGKLNCKLKNYSQAFENLNRANFIYESNGLLRKELEAKSKITESLIGLKRYSEAKTMTSEIYKLAKRINEIERVIDSIAMQAELEKEQGDIEQAVATSNRLIREIEKLSKNFQNTDRLVLYRQKIYDYLKNSVEYEIQNNRIDSAFVKLDYAKARALKFGKQHVNISTNGKSLTIDFMDIDTIKSRLGDQSLVVDYLVTQDTLYTFVLRNNNLQLLRNEVNQVALKEEVHAYQTLINKTIEIFDEYNLETINGHFDATTQMSQKLFQKLMGWLDRTLLFEDIELIYIVPDEFLYELPFSTLVAGTANKLTYLVHYAAVVNLPSASSLDNTGKSYLNLKNKRLQISADPNFPETKDFVLNVKKLFPLAEELTVERFPFDKYDALGKLNNGYDIYVILGHGSANNVNPDLSFIELNVNSTVDSVSTITQISIQDLKNMKWPGTEMVFLIGCETAGGKLYRGTGILGLQQGFLFLGTKSVLASLWKIAADYAIPQANEVLQSWQRFPNPAIALRETQLKSIYDLQHDDYFKKPHPYFWGNYMLLANRNYN